MASGSGVEKNALNASANAGSQAQQSYNQINPIYAQMAEGGYGFTPQQKSNMLTASGQSLGGAVSGAVGQGGLVAARTGNAGGTDAAIDDATRNAQVQGSENALGVENADASLAHQNQITGLNGLNSIYSDANRTGVDYLGTAQSASKNGFWKNLPGQLIGAGSSAADAYLGR